MIDGLSIWPLLATSLSEASRASKYTCKLPDFITELGKVTTYQPLALLRMPSVW